MAQWAKLMTCFVLHLSSLMYACTPYHAISGLTLERQYKKNIESLKEKWNKKRECEHFHCYFQMLIIIIVHRSFQSNSNAKEISGPVSETEYSERTNYQFEFVCSSLLNIHKMT